MTIDNTEGAGPHYLARREIQNLFPRCWLSGRLGGDEVQGVCDVTLRDGPPDTQAVIGIGWTPNRTARFIKDCTRALARPESWRPNPDTWIMSLHRIDKPCADTPLGFIGFRADLSYDPDAGPFLEFQLSLDFAWVTPALRGQGYGLHLVAHLARYFDTNPVPESHFGNTLDGLKVRISRPPAPGCIWTAKKLADSFEQDKCLVQMPQTVGLAPVNWPVLEVSVQNDD